MATKVPALAFTYTTGGVEAVMTSGSVWGTGQGGAYGAAAGKLPANANSGRGKSFRNPYSLGLSFGLALMASLLLWAGLIGIIFAVI